MSKEAQVKQLTDYMAKFIAYTAKKLPDDVIAKLKGIECGRKGTSCPDQIAIALEKIKKGEI